MTILWLFLGPVCMGTR